MLHVYEYAYTGTVCAMSTCSVCVREAGRAQRGSSQSVPPGPHPPRRAAPRRPRRSPVPRFRRPLPRRHLDGSAGAGAQSKGPWSGDATMAAIMRTTSGVGRVCSAMARALQRHGGWRPRSAPYSGPAPPPARLATRTRSAGRWEPTLSPRRRRRGPRGGTPRRRSRPARRGGSRRWVRRRAGRRLLATVFTQSGACSRGWSCVQAPPVLRHQ